MAPIIVSAPPIPDFPSHLPPAAAYGHRTETRSFTGEFTWANDLPARHSGVAAAPDFVHNNRTTAHVLVLMFSDTDFDGALEFQFLFLFPIT